MDAVVSIHVPAKGTTYSHRSAPVFHLAFQSTFPRRERPGIRSLVAGSDSFNPRSREGNDVPVIPSSPCITCFNPRSREGNDKRRKNRICPPVCFNPRSREGNDYELEKIKDAETSFNPRSREGNDNPAIRGYRNFIKFQSTFPRRERQLSFQPYRK